VVDVALCRPGEYRLINREPEYRELHPAPDRAKKSAFKDRFSPVTVRPTANAMKDYSLNRLSGWVSNPLFKHIQSLTAEGT
jgi:hypothetical protein